MPGLRDPEPGGPGDLSGVGRDLNLPALFRPRNEERAASWRYNPALRGKPQTGTPARLPTVLAGARAFSQHCCAERQPNVANHGQNAPSSNRLPCSAVGGPPLPLGVPLACFGACVTCMIRARPPPLPGFVRVYRRCPQ